MVNDRVVYEIIKGYIALVRINRPEKLNALNKDVWAGLADSFYRANKDERVRCVIFTGTGRAFSAGDDIYMMAELENTEDATNIFYDYVERAILSMARCEKPIIAAVNGLAYGGGMELLLLSDIVVAKKDVLLSVPEIKIGLLPPLMLALGPITIGLKKTITLAMLGDEITAEKALEMGYIDFIADDPMEKALEIAGRLASYSIDALREIKRHFIKFRLQYLSDVPINSLIQLMFTKNAKNLMNLFIKKK